MWTHKKISLRGALGKGQGLLGYKNSWSGKQIMCLPTECRITFNMLRINEVVGMSYKVCSCRTEKKTLI